MQEFNLIDKLDEIGMLYFVIVSLFSAETLVDVESCKASLKGIEMLRAELSTSKRKDDPKRDQGTVDPIWHFKPLIRF